MEDFLRIPSKEFLKKSLKKISKKSISIASEMIFEVIIGKLPESPSGSIFEEISVGFSRRTHEANSGKIYHRIFSKEIFRESFGRFF